MKRTVAAAWLLILISCPPGYCAEGVLEKIEASPGKGFHWPYYLFTPSAVRSSPVLLVEPNNTGTGDDDDSRHDIAARNLAQSRSKFVEALRCPLLVPTFPRPYTEWWTYTHALDRDTLLAESEELRRIDLQLVAMIDDALDLLATRGLSVDEKVFMMGFSASGQFGCRFTLLHPGRVKAASVGGAGYPIVPASEWDGEPLRYPVGVSDLAAVAGGAFDLGALKSVPLYVFVGDQDANDPVDYIDGFDPQDREAIERLFGDTPVNRFSKLQAVYDAAGCDSDFVVYPGVGHDYTARMQDDVIAFFATQLQRDAFLTPGEAAIGTESILTHSGLGSMAGKIHVAGVTLKVTSWSDSTVSWLLKKPIPPGLYDVTLTPKEPKGAPPIVFSACYEVKAPELDALSPAGGSVGSLISVTGSFFGTRKGSVFLVDHNGARIKCKVVGWSMDPTTNRSELSFLIPKKAGGYCDVMVVSQIGAGMIENALHIE